jgi:hypothetical protein
MNESFEAVQRQCPQCRKDIDSDARFCKYCAFDLASSPVNHEDPTIEPAKNRTIIYLALILGGIAVVAILFGALSLAFYYRSNNPDNLANASSTPSVPTLGAKAQKAEEKILRGELLSQNDIEGLNAEELRIVRNVHFARYGRKYDRPGLGDYFFNQPWYKPSDTYNDNLISATDKANINLLLSVEKSSNTGSVSTLATSQTTVSSPTPGSNSSSGSLTNSSVQSAVNSFMSSFTKGGSIVVEGIRELPNENAATADLRFSNWVCSTTYEGGLSKENPPPVTKDRFGMPSSTFGLRLVTYNTNGLAILTHFNDGRWVLKQVRVGEGFKAVNVTGTMEVK